MCTCSDPEDKQIQRELRALKGLIREEKAASAKVFKGALGAPPKPKPGGAAASSSSNDSSRRDGTAATAAAAAVVGAAAAAAGGASEISEAAADDGLSTKAAAMGSSRGPNMQLVLAALVLVVAVLAFMFGWLPGAGA